MHIIWLGEELPQAFVLGMALKTSNDGIAEGGMIFMSILFVEGGALRAPYIPNNIDHKKAPFWGANTKKLFFFWGGDSQLMESCYLEEVSKMTNKDTRLIQKDLKRLKTPR